MVSNKFGCATHAAMQKESEELPQLGSNPGGDVSDKCTYINRCIHNTCQCGDHSGSLQLA